MKFAGTMNQDQFYTWLNAPDLDFRDKYNPVRLTSEFVEVNQETWDEFLGCLPPIPTPYGFAISEETTYGIRLAFFRIDNRLFACRVEDGLYSIAASTIRDTIAKETA
jgi:hypothetical protein